MSDPNARNPLERLADTLDVLPEAVQALRADVRSAEAARVRAHRLNMLLTAFAVVLAAAVLVLVAGVLVVGRQNTRLARDVRATNNNIATTNNGIADCITPGGQCYERGRQRTDEAVGALTRISIYVAECARLYPGEAGPDFDVKVEACVAERLRRPRTPAPGDTPSPAPSR